MKKMNNIWLRKNKKRPNIILAPMAGYTDSAMRQICKDNGCDIVVSEMVSADAVYHNKKIRNKILNIKNKEFKTLLENDKTLSLMKFEEVERPFVVQLFGKYPEKFAYAARWVEKYIKPDGIDINMGCPAKKVVGSDHGSALLKNPDLACEIAKTVKESVKIPVSVKTRLGWSDDNEILKFAPRLVKTGVDALIIHGRTYKDGFKGEARWENVYRIKDKISKIKNKVSVIGNGDIRDYNQAIGRSKSGKIELDGVMIGRAAFGRPWIFKKNPRIANNELQIMVLKHVKLAYKDKGERGIIEFRKHLLAYLKGVKNAKALRSQAVQIKCLDDVKKIINKLEDRF